MAPGENVRDNYRQQGAQAERERLTELLYELQVIRDSMLGPEWVVIYTEQGPLDLKRSKLLGADNG